MVGGIVSLPPTPEPVKPPPPGPPPPGPPPPAGAGGSGAVADQSYSTVIEVLEAELSALAGSVAVNVYVCDSLGWKVPSAIVPMAPSLPE